MVQASVHGVVTDSTGARIPGATITVKPSGNEAAFTAVSNREGEFTVSNLVPGSYDVSAEQLGFNRVYRTVTLSPGQTTELPLALTVNLVSQNVTVTAQTAAVTEVPLHRPSPPWIDRT